MQEGILTNKAGKGTKGRVLRKGIDLGLVTIGQIVTQLLPKGSHISISSDGLVYPYWNRCPFWPPDVFAVAATLADITGCYAEIGIALSGSPRDRARKIKNAARAVALGNEWVKKGYAPLAVQRDWQVLFHAWNLPIRPSSTNQIRQSPSWKRAVLRLLAIADEASLGMGFPPVKDAPQLGLAGLAFGEYMKTHLYGKKATVLPNLPQSLCMLVPTEIACVQPKTMAPSVGCTLRSLSHHLALLPGIGTVATQWLIGHSPAAPDQNDKKPLNLLIVPFPYQVRITDFVVEKEASDAADGYFGLRQSWLIDRGRKLSSKRFAAFLTELIERAREEAGEVHGIVIPEAALTKELSDQLASNLVRRKGSELELLVAGAIDPSSSPPRNIAAIYRLGRTAKGNPNVRHRTYQSKHHRWKLESSQIRRYHLGHALSVQSEYWENIGVSDRSVGITLIRRNASLVALICEDLARFDPVLPAINAIGPNLVIALLMDGPLLRHRWPNRYATVLADDPGSSVLCVTSIGMVRRSHLPGDSEFRIVALWRDASGVSQEISLPRGAQAVMVNLARETIDQTSLDLRKERGETVRFTLGGVRAIFARDVPTWARESD